MLCDDCGNEEAEVHVTSIEGEVMSTVHLCASCAAERGLAAESAAGDAPSKPPLLDFLGQLDSTSPAASTAGASEPCPFCGITASDFRSAGRVGCSQCYVHFESQLSGLLRRIHGSAHHSGKVYISETSEISDRLGQLSSMRRRLKRAIETEDFETAAKLRDRIHEIEVQA